jgi:hypothetical protein
MRSDGVWVAKFNAVKLSEQDWSSLDIARGDI